MPTSNNTKRSELVRGLGLWAATAVIVGSMVGQSIFLVPSEIARDAGSMGRVFAAWLVGGVLVLFAAFCYAELGAALPEAGGDFVYLGRALGPRWGFLYGWTLALLQGPAMAAMIAAGLLRITGFLLPSLAAPIFTWRVSAPFVGQPHQFTLTAAQAWAALTIAAVAGINYFGVRTAGRVQVLLTGLKVTAIVVIVALGLAMRKVGGIDTPATAAPLAYGGIGAFLTALVPAMAAYNGFQSLGQVGGEVANPHKTIPRAVILGVLTVITLYVLINVVYIRVLGIFQVANSQHVASDAAVKLVGPGGTRWLTIVMMLSALGSLHASFLARPRVPYAMARNGQFFKIVRRIQPTFHTPSGAILFHGCLSILLVLTGTFEEIYSLGIFSIWIFLALTAISLIRLRVREPALPRPYRAWGYPWTPLVLAASAFAITANLWRVRPLGSSIGIALILLGIPFFHHWQKRAADPPLVETPPSAEV